MALVRNAANTLRKGRIGETTYYASKGRQIARQALNNSNYGESARRSLAQQTRRVKWANLVNFYKLCAGWMPKAFETKKAGQTDYNKFMQLNVNAQRVALTREQALNGGCVADIFAITQGSLKPANLRKIDTDLQSDIEVGAGFAITANTTVGQLAQEIISNNSSISAGMQLSVVCVTSTEDDNGTPRCSVDFYEIVLDTASSELLTKYVPEGILTVGINSLVCSVAGESGGMAAIILSQLTNTGLKVSSEILVGDTTQAQQYSTAAVVDAAIATYGLDKEVVLNPDSAEPIA